MNQYNRKFKPNLIFQRTITLEITDTGRSQLIFLTYTLDCIARSTVCGSTVNPTWSVLLRSQYVAWLSVEEFNLFCISCLKAQKGLLHLDGNIQHAAARDNSAVIFKFNICDIYCIYSVLTCMKHA